MKKVIRLTESDLVRIVKRVISENTISQKRVKFFDTIASKISSNLINKKFYFGKIGVLEGSSIIIKSYEDRNHSIDIQGEKVKDLGLYFNVTRDKEDLYPNEKKGSRIWSGLLEIRAEFKNGMISKSPIVNLYLTENGKTYFDREMKPEKPFTWNQVGGAQIWSQAINGEKL